MTRKDYIAIANAIRATNQRIRDDRNIKINVRMRDQLRGVRRAAAALADALADDNPRGFDAQVFLRNCGYAGEVRATQPVDPLRVRKDRAGLNLQEQLARARRGEILDN